MLKKLTLVVFVGVLTGCAASTHYTNTVPINQEPKKATATQWDHFFIGGIGQESELDAADICGDPESVIKTTGVLTPGNWLVGVLTLGIYTPLTSEVYCAD